jgi:Protein of unknown function (DUF4230)
MAKERLLNALIIIAIITCLSLMFVVVVPKVIRLASGPQIGSSPVMLQQVQTLAQLVTVKYVVEKVVLLEDTSKWYELSLGENSVLMVAHGIVKAGVDLKEVKPGDIEASGKKVTIKLPPTRITDCYLDDKRTEVIERKTGLLRSFDKDLEQNARKQAVEEISIAARNDGILKDAQERAKDQLTVLFLQMGYEEVRFK